MTKLLALGLIILGGIAPVVPASNGRISVAVFEDKTTHQIQYYQMSDTQYSLMGQKGGSAYNPASTTASWRTSFQYSAGTEPFPTTDQTSATSTLPEVKPSPVKNFKDDDTISLFKLISKTPLVERAYAAIARDATSTSGVVTATSQTWAHTVTGSNPVLLLYGFVRNTTATNLQLATYNGVQMSTTTPAWADYLEGRYAWMMHLANPSTGTNNIVTLHDSSVSTTWAAVSYTGAAQSGIPDSVVTNPGDGSSNNYTLSTTVVAANSWVVLMHIAVDAICSSATSPDVLINIDNPIMADSNAGVAAGAYDIGLNGCGNRVQAKGIVSLAPFVAATPTGNDQPVIYFIEW